MKSKLLNIITLIIGILTLWVFVDHFINFQYPDYFYNANPGITYYVGINVVSKYADFSFFTYHTMIIFSIWCISLSVSSLLKFDKLYNLCVNRNIVVFVFVNYFLTTLLYTIFELTSGNITFGLYALNFNGIHNFVTNILGHYFFFFFNVFLFIKVKTKGVMKKKYFVLMSCYVLIYLIYVKLSGMYFYNIEWYPYPIFDFSSLFGLFGINVSVPVIIEYIVIFILFILMSMLYYRLLIIFNKIKKDKN